MPSLIQKEFKILNAENFIRAISTVTDDRNVLYMFIGRDSAWSLDSNGLEDPATPVDTLHAEELTTRANIVALKRITEGGISHVVRRIDWTTGTVYAEYSNDEDGLFELDFYVLTDDFNVYKCLDNNNGGASTVKPTGQSTSPIITGDSYEWKFMYNIPAGDVVPFLTLDWMPVPTGLRKSALQLAVEVAASYTVGDPLDGHGANAYRELGAYYLLITARFEEDEGGEVPTDDDYRQIGLIVDPLMTNTNGDVAATTSVLPGDDINRLSGRIIYVENRDVISRAPSQVEDHKVVVEL